MAIGIDYNSGIPHTDGAPVHDPGTNGGKVAYDHVARVLYKHVSGTTWEVLATGGGGGGDSLGAGFTSGGGSGTIPTGTIVTIGATLEITGADDDELIISTPVTTFALGVTFDGVATFNDLAYFNSPTVFSASISSPSFQTSAAGGAVGMLLDTTVEEAEKIIFVISDSPKLNIYANGSVEATTTTGAFIPPKLTTAERDALTPDEGWQIYNITAHKLQVYDGTTWQSAW